MLFWHRGKFAPLPSNIENRTFGTPTVKVRTRSMRAGCIAFGCDSFGNNSISLPRPNESPTPFLCSTNIVCGDVSHCPPQDETSTQYSDFVFQGGAHKERRKRAILLATPPGTMGDISLCYTLYLEYPSLSKTVTFQFPFFPSFSISQQSDQTQPQGQVPLTEEKKNHKKKRKKRQHSSPPTIQSSSKTHYIYIYSKEKE